MSATGLPTSAYTTIETDDGSMKLCKLITGLWQTSGRHGYSTDNFSISREMATLVEQGFCTYEIPVMNKESAELIGSYRNLVGRRFADSQSQIIIRISLEPNEPDYPSRLYVEGLIDSALTRMGGAERLDMVLLSWTEIDGIVADDRFCEVLHHCNEMRREGKIALIALANLPTAALQFARNQDLRFDAVITAYSLLDRRPAHEMVAWCQEHKVSLMVYSSIGGGFLSDRYLGLPEPTRGALTTESLRRFALTVRIWGGWSLLQELLFVLKGIADKYRVSIANVALRWVLEQEGVSAVIVGARLALGPEGNHFKDNQRVFYFKLDDDDRNSIEEVASRANDLYSILGDAGWNVRNR